MAEPESSTSDDQSPPAGLKSWLAAVPDDVRSEIRDRLTRHTFVKGAYLMHEGDPADALWIVESGNVAAQTNNSDGVVATLNVMGPGEVIGELGLVGATGERTVSIVALNRVRARCLAKSDFEAARDASPNVDRFLVGLLVEHVVRLSRLLNDAYVRDADTRVLRRLVALTGAVSQGERATVPIDQATLASLAGASRQTANRVLRSAEQAGWIELGRGRIEVLDALALRAAADL